MYFIIYNYQKGWHASLGDFPKERYGFSNGLDNKVPKGEITHDMCGRWEYEISHEEHPAAVFCDLSLRHGISEVSDEGKLASNFIKNR